MKDLLWLVAGFLIGGLILAPLLWETWFTWRMWTTGSMLLAAGHYLYCMSQMNKITAVQAIVRAINEFIKKWEEKEKQ